MKIEESTIKVSFFAEGQEIQVEVDRKKFFKLVEHKQQSQAETEDTVSAADMYVGD